MRYLKTFGRFWYDFIVGDDWKLAVGGVAAVGATYFAAHHGVNAWLLLPACVAGMLLVSLVSATRSS